MKTLLILEIGYAKATPWEIGTVDGDDNYSEDRSGSLAPEDGLETLKELMSQVDEVWECDSLATRNNMRKTA